MSATCIRDLAQGIRCDQVASIFEEQWKPFPKLPLAYSAQHLFKDKTEKASQLANGCPIEGLKWHQELKPVGIPATEDRLTR